MKPFSECIHCFLKMWVWKQTLWVGVLVLNLNSGVTLAKVLNLHLLFLGA